MKPPATFRERVVGTPLHDLLGVFMLAWSYAPAVAALWLFSRERSVATFVLAFVVVSFRMNALFIVVHESWHFNLFRSRKANEWLGSTLASYPIVMPYFQDRNTHWNHHRFVGTLKDPDAWAWDFPDDRRVFLREIGKVASGASYLERIWRVALGRPAPPPPADRPPRPMLEGGVAKKEIVRLAAVHAAILGIFAVTVGWVWYFPLWLAPGLSLFPAVGMLREFLEHRRGALIVYRAGWTERFLLGCFNFHLHAYHHVHASAPWFTLPSMRERCERKVPGIVYLESYFLELGRYLRGTSTVPFRTATPDGAPMPAGDVPLQAREAAAAVDAAEEAEARVRADRAGADGERPAEATDEPAGKDGGGEDAA